MISVVDQQTYKTEEAEYESVGKESAWNNRIYLDKHGVKFTLSQIGSLAVFSFTDLLVTLTTSLALLALSTTVVDNLAVNILPLKKLYAASKYDTTVDFDALGKKK